MNGPDCCCDLQAAASCDLLLNTNMNFSGQLARQNEQQPQQQQHSGQKQRVNTILAPNLWHFDAHTFL